MAQKQRLVEVRADFEQTIVNKPIDGYGQLNHLSTIGDLKIERFYQLTGTYNSFESVLCLKTYEIHTYKQKLRFLAASRFTEIATGVFHCNN